MIEVEAEQSKYKRAKAGQNHDSGYLLDLKRKKLRLS